MAKQIVPKQTLKRQTKPPLLPPRTEIESIQESDISMNQALLIGALALSHILTNYPIDEILREHPLEDLATAYRLLWYRSATEGLNGYHH